MYSEAITIIVKTVLAWKKKKNSVNPEEWDWENSS